jgi:deoxyinosine 3'endonuclease (endonuclease V)
MLKSKLILEDDFVWSLPLVGSSSAEDARGKLKYIGGTDISFLKEDPSTACAAVVILDAVTLEVVHEEFVIVQLQVPYIPGFLAFREVSWTNCSCLLHISINAQIVLIAA